MKKTIKVVDSLSLIASKVAPDVFDVSSGQFHVSLRDQMVRARLLVRDLHALDPAFKNLLIIGAGAAGIVAAAAAADLEKRVFLLEGKHQPMSLQDGVNVRFVGPFMYEWPWDFSCDQRYPPVDAGIWDSPTLAPVVQDRQPMAASQFARQMRAWLIAQMSAHPTIHVAVDVKAETVKEYVADYVQAAGRNSGSPRGSRNSIPSLYLQNAQWWNDSEPKVQSISPDYIILAAGMGQEMVSLPSHDGVDPVAGTPFPGKIFWSNDDLAEHAANGQPIAVVGGGDGALQDVLRALTPFDHPLAMLQHLRECPHVADLIDGVQQRLQAIEAQGRLLSSWTLDAATWEVLDGKCKAVAMTLAADPKLAAHVLECLRKRETPSDVFLFVKDAYFDKAYLLNRFLVYLVHFVTAGGTPSGREGYPVTLKLLFEVKVEGVQKIADSDYRVHCVEKSGEKFSVAVACVAVRFGIDKKSIPGLKMIQISGPDSGQRTALSHVPLPFVI